jgi:hypothetical protein
MTPIGEGLNIYATPDITLLWVPGRWLCTEEGAVADKCVAALVAEFGIALIGDVERIASHMLTDAPLDQPWTDDDLSGPSGP